MKVSHRAAAHYQRVKKIRLNELFGGPLTDDEFLMELCDAWITNRARG